MGQWAFFHQISGVSCSGREGGVLVWKHFGPKYV